jgi:hypothetical protein
MLDIITEETMSTLKQQLISTGLSEKAAENIANNVTKIQVMLSGGLKTPPLTDEQKSIILAYQVEQPEPMVLDFGKFKGQKVVDVASSAEGRSYLTWAIRTVDAQTTDAIITELRRNGYQASILDGVK